LTEIETGIQARIYFFLPSSRRPNSIPQFSASESALIATGFCVNRVWRGLNSSSEKSIVSRRNGRRCLTTELSAGAKNPKDRLLKLDASVCIRTVRPTSQPENTEPLQDDDPAVAAGKGTPRQLQPGPSGSTACVSTLQVPTLAGTAAMRRRDTGEPNALAAQGQIFSQGNATVPSTKASSFSLNCRNSSASLGIHILAST
jgi:hypothetical protein